MFHQLQAVIFLNIMETIFVMMLTTMRHAFLMVGTAVDQALFQDFVRNVNVLLMKAQI